MFFYLKTYVCILLVIFILKQYRQMKILRSVILLIFSLMTINVLLEV